MAGVVRAVPPGNYVAPPLPPLSTAPSLTVAAAGPADQLRPGHLRGAAADLARHLSDARGEHDPRATACSRKCASSGAVVRARRVSRQQGANIGGIYVTAVDANQAVQVMLAEIAKLQTEDVATRILTAARPAIPDDALPGPGNQRGAGGRAGRGRARRRWLAQRRHLPRSAARRHTADVRRVANTYMRNIPVRGAGNPSTIDQQIFTPQLVR